jgi:non-specific serine/threonine protein kinase
MIGETVYQYQILEKIGSGGMGEVYLAEDTKLNRKVALKFLPIHLSSDKALNTRFINEARAAAKLNHPNIITIHEVSEYDGRPFFAMEHVEGNPLSDVIEKDGLTSDQAVDIILQISEGLKAAHKAGIVHRDIKPSNVIIDESGRCRILDFGLAAIQSEERLTRTGSLLGTVEYMSPEQVRGEKIDPRSDIFSLGVLLYEMLTGQLPFKGDYVAGVVYSIINESPETLVKHKPEIPDLFQAIIDKVLEKDPELRYRHIDDLQADLKKINSEQETVAIQKSSVYIKPVRRLIIPATAIIAIVLLFLIFKPWRIVIEPDQRAIAAENRLAVMYFDNLADPDDSQKLGEIAANLLITDLSESNYLQVISSQRLYDILKILGREGQKRVDRDVATQIAEKADAKYMLMGSILRDKPHIILTAQLIDVSTGNIIASQRIEGEQGMEIFPLVDRLTIEIKGDLALPSSAQKELDPVITDITTHSQEAYRHYLDGVDLQKKHYFMEAQESFKKALDYDSTFAMAYFWLSRSQDPTQMRSTRKKWIEKAIKFSDNATQKEKHYIRAQEQMLSLNYEQAINEFQKILERYPDEKEAYQGMGSAYYLSDRYSEAIGVLETAIEIDSVYKNAYNMLAYNYFEIGDYEKALWAINKYISLAPDEANPYDTRGDIYRDNSEIDKAIESYEKALEIKPDFFTTLYKLGNIYIFKKRYIDAEDIFVRICSTDDLVWRSRGRYGMAYIPLYQGKFNQALEVLDKGIGGDELDHYYGRYNSSKHALKAVILREKDRFESAIEEIEMAIEIFRRNFPDDRTEWLNLYVSLLAENNEIAKAEEIAEAARKEIKEKYPNRMYSYWIARGNIEFYRSNLDAARIHFEMVVNERERPGYGVHYKLGLTYLKMGMNEEAINELEADVAKYTSVRAFQSILEVKSYYHLGIAYEESGWINKAIEQYEEFLDIWKNADPGIEEIDDARARLAKLKQGT